jgi:acetoacetyl-CoA synthetase
VLDKVRAVSGRLPTVERVVLVGVLEEDPDVSGIPGAVTLAGFVAGSAAGEIAFARLPFGHPLYILFSSGTTGAPKCIVHGAGGTLLKHLTEHRHHSEVRPGDRLFYYSTLNWMMWNWLASGLASDATLVLYDGSPLARDGGVLFDLAEAERLTHMGVSARFLHECRRKALRPRETHRLDALRVVLSTGSPLLPEGFDWVYESLKEDVCLSSISGGTDIVGGFVVGSPVLPVWRGEIQCRALGMAVESFDEQGRPVRGRSGELVCTRPFPSMPLGFWNDPDGSRYRAAYFERFPGVWTHGDWVEITEHDGVIIHGRSDAVLNPGGVRIGTAEIYRQVEQVEGVAESVAIGQAWQGDTRIVLFVTLEDGALLDEELRARIRERLRTHASPHHVPAKILQVSDIPRTRSGKVVELAVRDIVEGRPVKSLEALANPEALEEFRGRAELAG